MPSLSINRRKFIALGAAAVAGAGIQGVVLEPNRPRLVQREMALKRWPSRLDGFTIALLTDFHYDPYFSEHPIHASIGIVNALAPDLIVLTGDFVSMPLFGSGNEKAAAAAIPCAQLLGRLRATHGLWAVLGNHDCYTDPNVVTRALQGQGINVLANQSIPVERDGGRFWLAGVKDVLSQPADVQQTLASIAVNEPVVLLVHEPDYADHVSHFPVDLQLSGHSHGGQVRLPFVRPLYLPELARKYISGLYKIGALTLYTNPGLGTVGVPVRLNCPPEITLLTMRRASPNDFPDSF